MNIYNNMDGLEQENLLLKQKIQELEERLKKYTNGDNHKRYYEKNKDKVKEIGANYLNKLKEEDKLQSIKEVENFFKKK
jgi:predicted MPP superfamily phosphohydrolase